MQNYFSSIRRLPRQLLLSLQLVPPHRRGFVHLGEPDTPQAVLTAVDTRTATALTVQGPPVEGQPRQPDKDTMEHSASLTPQLPPQVLMSVYVYTV